MRSTVIHDGRILVVEDEPALRIDLVEYLSGHGWRVDHSGSRAESLDYLLHDRPDIIVLDLALPDGSGLEIAAATRRRYDLSVGIIVLTAYGDEEHRLAGRGAGADIYLVKTASLREIETCCRNLMRRLVTLPSSADGSLSDWQLDEINWRLHTPDGSSVSLTATEIAFLRPLMAAPHIPQSRSVLSAGNDPRNLDAVVCRLRRKIESASRHAPPFKTVYGAGYVFTGAKGDQSRQT